jgi:hypothetical protein
LVGMSAQKLYGPFPVLLTAAAHGVPATCPSARAMTVNRGHRRKIKPVSAGDSIGRSGATSDTDFPS